MGRGSIRKGFHSPKDFKNTLSDEPLEHIIVSAGENLSQ